MHVHFALDPANYVASSRDEKFSSFGNVKFEVPIRHLLRGAGSGIHKSGDQEKVKDGVKNEEVVSA